MLPTFASPWLLWGLLSVGVLAVVYMLRMRSRRLVVSSLLLWIDQRTTDTGGRVWQKLRTPLAFFVELLALVLLVLAAANPLWPRDGAVPIVIVLDNSYSMRASPSTSFTDSSVTNPARAGNSPAPTTQDLAREKLGEMLEANSLNAQVILAGVHPMLLSERFNSTDSLDRLTPHWQCLDPIADLDSAITLARQVGGLGARVLVVTDQVGTKPEKEEEKEDEKASTQVVEPTLGEQVRWIAVGRPLSNLAIVSAVRRDVVEESGQGRAIVEVANLSTEPIISELAVRLGEQHSARPLDIKPGEIRRFTIPIPDNRTELELTLPPDALELDNRTVLLPESVAKLRVSLSIQDKTLREALHRALEASGRVEMTDVAPQLRFSDSSIAPREGCWDVVFLDAEDSRSVLGPFVLEKTHELLEGVTLEGIVMSQSESIPMQGRPLVTSDRATLVSLDNLPDERERLFVQYGPEKTTLLDSLDFPVLVWNLLRWREGGLPERCRPNVRLGEPIRLQLMKERKQVERIDPSGKSAPLEIFGDATIFSCDQPGRHEVVLEKGTESERRLPLSVNVLFRDESDLRTHRAGEWGKWTVTDETRRDYFSILLPLLLAALVIWVAHGWVIHAEV